jgi:hypothetical protein
LPMQPPQRLLLVSYTKTPLKGSLLSADSKELFGDTTFPEQPKKGEIAG